MHSVEKVIGQRAYCLITGRHIVACRDRQVGDGANALDGDDQSKLLNRHRVRVTGGEVRAHEAVERPVRHGDSGDAEVGSLALDERPPVLGGVRAR